MAPSHRRGPWVPEEDHELLRLVCEQGPNNWVRISQHMQYRSPKQCRERFHQNLKPSLNHTPISADEGLMIERMVTDMGKRWAEIARRLGNRSDNAVKNWWNGSMNRKRRGLVVQTAHASRTCHGRIEAPYPRASMTDNHMRRPSWSLRKSHVERSPVRVSHLVADGSSSTDSARRLASIITYPSHGVEAGMTSPAFSEMSSLDPPSMMSDHNSVSSASPRTLPSPQMLPVPVDVRQAYVERRGSAPSFHFHSSAGDDIYMSSEPTPVTRWGPDFPTPMYKPTGHHYSNSVPEAPTTPPEEDRSSSRDVRMGVNSLLN